MQILTFDEFKKKMEQGEQQGAGAATSPAPAAAPAPQDNSVQAKSLEGTVDMLTAPSFDMNGNPTITPGTGVQGKPKDALEETAQLLAFEGDVPPPSGGRYGSRYGKGNIDLYDRDTGLYDEDGSLMTVRSMSFGEDGKEILVPTVVKKDGKWQVLSDDEAIDWYHRTGEYLGKFDTVEEANAYADSLHRQQEDMYARPREEQQAPQAEAPQAEASGTGPAIAASAEGKTPEGASPGTASTEQPKPGSMAFQLQQAQKDALKNQRDGLQEQYNELAANIYGAGKRIGVDYTAEDVEKLNAMEEQIRGLDEQIDAMQRPIGLKEGAEALGAGVYTGLEGAGLNFTRGLDWLLGEDSAPWWLVKESAPLFGLDLEGKNPISALRRRGEEEVAGWRQKSYETVAGNDVWEKVSRHAQNIAQSSPFIVLNLMTLGGASAAGASTEGLRYLSGLNSASSGFRAVGMMAEHGLKALAADPSAEYAFMSTFGESYYDAIKDGASPTAATLYAALNSSYNAMIEVGGVDEALGGLQALPADVQRALLRGDRAALLRWARLTGQEIGEEEFQDFMATGFKNIYRDDIPVFSTTDENAIFYPERMLQTAKDTAIDAGIMVGGNMAIQSAANRPQSRQHFGEDPDTAPPAETQDGEHGEQGRTQQGQDGQQDQQDQRQTGEEQQQPPAQTEQGQEGGQTEQGDQTQPPAQQGEEGEEPAESDRVGEGEQDAAAQGQQPQSGQQGQQTGETGEQPTQQPAQEGQQGQQPTQGEAPQEGQQPGEGQQGQPGETGETQAGEQGTPPQQGEQNPPEGGEEQGKISQFWSNTLRKLEESEGVPEDVATPLRYIPVSEAESLAKASAMLAADRQGTIEQLVQSEAWSGSQTDAAYMVRDGLMAQARQTGDWSAVQAWRHIMKQHEGDTARGLQAGAKYTRTGMDTAMDALDTLDTIEDLDPAERERIRAAIMEAGEALDRAEMSRDLKDIRDVIEKLATARNTSTFLPENFRKLLDEVDDFDWLYEYATRQTALLAEDADYRPGLGERMKTWQVLSQLTRLPTFFRNLEGNAGFGLLEMLSTNGAGVAVDWALSKLFGLNRSVGFDTGIFSKNAIEAARRAWIMSTLEVAGDVNMGHNRSSIESQDGSEGPRFDNGRDNNRWGLNRGNRTNRMSGGPVTRMMSRWEQLLGYSLVTPDAGFRGLHEQSLYDGLIAQGIPEEQAREIARRQAGYRVFHNDGIASGAFRGLHDTLNLAGIGGELRNGQRRGGFGLGDAVMPYPGVPGNLAVKPVEYSPLNALKGIGQLLAKGARHELDTVSQNEAVMNIARGLTGTGLIAAMTALFRCGLFRNTDDEKDKDAAAQQRAEGKNGVQLNLSAMLRGLDGRSMDWRDGDDLLSFGSVEPLNGLLGFASAIDAEARDEDHTRWSMTKAGLAGAFQAVADMPVFTSMQNAMNTLQYGGTGWDVAASLAGEAVGGMIPAPVGQIARTTDDVYRDTIGDSRLGTALNSVISGIPGLRQTLPVKQDNFGNPKEYPDSALQRFLNNFVLPNAVNEVNQTEVGAATEALYKATGDPEVYPDRNAPGSFQAGGKTYRLSAAEKRAFHKTYGAACEQAYAEIFSDAYADLSDAERAELCKEAKAYAGYCAKREYLENLGDEYENSKYDKIFERVQNGESLAYVLSDPTPYVKNGGSAGNVLQAAGLSQQEAWDMAVEIGAADEKGDATGTLTQADLWAYYLAHPDREDLMQTLWDSNEWAKSWEEYKTGKSKGAGGATLALQQAGLDADKAAEMVDAVLAADEKGNSTGTMTQADIWSYYQEHPEDEDYLKALWDRNGWAKDWETYKAGKEGTSAGGSASGSSSGSGGGNGSGPKLKSGSRAGDVLQEAGMSADEAAAAAAEIDGITAEDHKANGSLTQAEIYAWYIADPKAREQYAAALWSEQGWKTSWDAYQAKKSGK